MKKVVLKPGVGTVTTAAPISSHEGTEQVDPIVAFVGRTITDLANLDRNNDDKVDGSEILSFSWSRSQDAFGAFRGWSVKNFLSQLRDLTPEERQAQIQNFAKNFDLPNDQVEWLIEDWLLFLENGANLVARTKRVFGRKAQ